MLWLHKSEEIVKEVIVEKLIPVGINDTRPHKEKWEDETYLRQAIELGKNMVYQGELLNAISKLDSVRANAEDKQHMKGLNAGMAVLKQLLVVSEAAINQLEGVLFRKESIKNADGTH